MFVEAHAPGSDPEAPLDYCRSKRCWSLGIEVAKVLRHFVADSRMGWGVEGSSRDPTRLKFKLFFFSYS
jgi:hypothetical protein